MTDIGVGVDGAVVSMEGLATGADAAGMSMGEGIAAGVDEATISLEDLQVQVDAAVASFLDVGTEGATAGEELGTGITAGTEEADVALDTMATTTDTAVDSTKASLGGLGPAAMAAGIGLIAGLALDHMVSSAIETGSAVYDLSKELGVSGSPDH
jgi:hypothetical protein